MKGYPRWPLWLIALPAAVAVWSGWVGLGGMSGFGVIHPLPGIIDSFRLNTAITLPIGVEAYGAYALGAWLHHSVPESARKFARRSAIGSLLLGMLGQVAYHLLAAAHRVTAPWPVIVLVSCLPVVVLGFGAALTHLIGRPEAPAEGADDGAIVPSGTVSDVTVTGGSGEPSSSPVTVAQEGFTDLRAQAQQELVAQATHPRRFAGVEAVNGSLPKDQAPKDAKPQRARHAKGAPTVEAVEREFYREIEAGEVPALAEIQRRLRVGPDKAKSYRQHLTQVTRARREAVGV